MAKRHGFVEPDPERENVWRIVVRIPPPPEKFSVRISPDFNDGTREEIEDRLNAGEELEDILTDPEGNISF